MNEPRQRPRTIVFIGASFLFLPKVVTDLARRGREFAGSRLVIHDIEPSAIELMVRVSRRISEAAGVGFTVDGQPDLDAALASADHVLVCISVGGREAAMADIELCKRFGCEHVIGDTIGPAALLRNLRTCPAVERLAGAIDRVCPTATVINFANPMSVITRTLAMHTRARVVGLCHGTDELVQLIAGAYDVGVDRVSMSVAGVNHLAFACHVAIDGDPVAFDRLFDRLEAYERSSQYDARDPAWGSALSYRYTIELGRRLGRMPNNPDRHTVEFFPWFLKPQRMLFTAETADYADRIRRHRQLEQSLRHLADGQVPPALDKPSGERADEFILACESSAPRRIVVNAPNAGAVIGVDDASIVEAYRRVDRSGIGLADDPLALPPQVLNLVQRLIQIHELTIEASRTLDPDLLVRILMLEGNSVEFDDMRSLAGAMVDHHRRGWAGPPSR